VQIIINVKVNRKVQTFIYCYL